MKISVIVPIYNKEKELSKTIESLVHQTIKEIEIILVNDGSTDKSKEVINLYQEKYPDKVKAFHKGNGGLSSARNYGITKATGDYLSFVDAGDYVSMNLYDNLIRFMDRKIDLIKFKMQTVTNTGKILKRIDGPIFEECSGQIAFEKLYTTDTYLEVACIYLYRRKFFVENGFEYNENQYHETYGGAYHEDFGLTPLILLKAKTVISVKEDGYFYVQDDNSITRNNDYEKVKDKANDLLVHYDYMINQIQEDQTSDQKAKEQLKSYYTNVILLKVGDLNKEDQKQYIKQIKQRKMLKNVKVKNIKQLIKKILLAIDIRLYLKMR